MRNSKTANVALAFQSSGTTTMFLSFSTLLAPAAISLACLTASLAQEVSALI